MHLRRAPDEHAPEETLRVEDVELVTRRRLVQHLAQDALQLLDRPRVHRRVPSGVRGY